MSAAIPSSTQERLNKLFRIKEEKGERKFIVLSKYFFEK